ncbi:MAG: hydroxyacid dehydrogenase [Ignisphaera sp.]|nr:hydroxyacid dehydrogenase [Ignisphaera sp.]MCX8167562.1 hydroxyacid dehydrogenase [Ignisphaera sp.]MDW8086029.1 hydroxyacid dehydrogenase [Ignisphaera sp.]
MNFRVVFTAPIHSDGINIVKNVAEVDVLSTPPLSEEELIRSIASADALVPTLGIEPITRRVIERASRLKIIARHGVGYNNIDIDAATEHGIWVTITPVEELLEAVADHAFALLLCIARNICRADRFVKSSRWGIDSLDKLYTFTGVGLRGKTIGIIGLGRIGRRVAERAKGFKMKIVYYDIVRKAEAEEHGIEYRGLEDLLRESDFIIIATPLTDRTRDMIGEREISLMKPTAYIINIARGGIVNQKALYRALKEGRIAGAALDVFQQEPIPAGDPLLELENTVLTPHIAWLTDESRRAMAITVAEEVTRVLMGEDPKHPVNPKVKEILRAKGKINSR